MDVIESAARPRRSRALALVGAGLVGGVVLAGWATANAQTPSPSTGSESDAGTSAPGPGRGGRGHGKHGGHGMGIHGEFVTPNAAGDGYQTIATQKGEVTAVSATSLTVRSEDGFSRTYTVNDDTLVNAGNDGIDDVRSGDDVRVTALVADGKASAVRVDDGTNIERLNGRWMPPRPERPTATESAAA